MSTPNSIGIIFILTILAIISFPEYFRPRINQVIGAAIFALLGSGFGILPAIMLGIVGYQLQDKPQNKGKQ